MTLFVIEFLFLFVSEWFCFAKQIKQQIFYNFIWILSENFRSDYINLNSLRQFCAIVIKFQFHPSYCVRTGLLDVYRDLPHCEIVRRSADRGREFPQSRRDQMFPSVKPGGPCAPFVLDSDFRFDLNILPFATFFFPPTHSEQSPLHNCTDYVAVGYLGCVKDTISLFLLADVDVSPCPPTSPLISFLIFLAEITERKKWNSSSWLRCYNIAMFEYIQCHISAVRSLAVWILTVSDCIYTVPQQSFIVSTFVLIKVTDIRSCLYLYVISFFFTLF